MFLAEGLKMDWMFYYVQVGSTFIVFILVSILNVRYSYFSCLPLVVWSFPCHKGERTIWSVILLVCGREQTMVAFPCRDFCLLKGETNAYLCHCHSFCMKQYSLTFSSRVLSPLVSYLSHFSGSFYECWIRVRHWRLSMIWVRMSFL